MNHEFEGAHQQFHSHTRSTNFQNCEIEEFFIIIKESSIERKNYLNHL